MLNQHSSEKTGEEPPLTSLIDPTPAVPSTVIAGLLICARKHLARLDLPHPEVTAIVEAMDVARSRAYEIADRLEGLLAGLVHSIGRPAKPEPTPSCHESERLGRALLDYVMAHPGCVSGSSHRRIYSDGFRLTILELREAHRDLELGAFAEAVRVPLGTLEDWLRVGPDGFSKTDAQSDDGSELDESRSIQIESILAAFEGWCGNFASFCSHVRHHLRLHYGDSFIARTLHVHGERTPRPRKGRSPDEEATKDTFEIFFPGAQWVGDGMAVEVHVNDEPFTFNLELAVDAASGAFVGASLRDEEDSAAVVASFEDGVTTTGDRPLAMLLDNRPSNHTDVVDAAFGDTLRIRATRSRPQNKAHVEGAFGLFSQEAPALVVHAKTPREFARELLRLRVQTFFRTLNHRPRRDRSWRSRIDLYRSSSPTDEEIAEAKRALEERRRRQDRAYATQLARSDPLVIEALDDAFARLGLLDPDRHFRLAIARYDRDTVADSIAIFEAKLNLGTLPENAGASYLLGIVKNLAHIHEADAITLALIKERVSLRDRWLAHLDEQSRAALALHPEPQAALRDLIDRALSADRMIDRFFWIDSTASLLREQPTDLHRDLFRSLAKQIHAHFALSTRERSAFERRLARLVWPLR